MTRVSVVRALIIIAIVPLVPLSPSSDFFLIFFSLVLLYVSSRLVFRIITRTTQRSLSIAAH